MAVTEFRRFFFAYLFGILALAQIASAMPEGLSLSKGTLEEWVPADGSRVTHHWISREEMDLEVPARVCRLSTGPAEILAPAEVLSVAALEHQAQLIWTACAEAGRAEGEGEVVLEPYDAGARYLPPDVLRCLNVRTLAQASLNRTLPPVFKQVFDERLAEGAAIDEERLRGAQKDWVDQVVAELIRGESGNFEFQECRARALGRFRSSAPQEKYRYSAMDPKYSAWSDEACSRVRLWVIKNEGAVPPGGPVIPTPTQKSSLDPVWSRLFPLLLDAARPRWEECGKRFGAQLESKRICLVDSWIQEKGDPVRKSAWNSILDQALQKWVTLPEVQKLGRSLAETDESLTRVAHARAEAERNTLLHLVLDAFFK